MDYRKRQELLVNLPAEGEVDEAALRDLLANAHDGRVKFFVTSRLLAWCRTEAEIFDAPDYRPLGVSHTAAEHVVGLARPGGDTALIVIVPRLPATLLGGGATWPCLQLPGAPRRYECRSTGILTT